VPITDNKLGETCRDCFVSRCLK